MVYQIFLFSSLDNTKASTPTSNGWVHAHNQSSANLTSDLIQFNHSHQFTIEFEVFPFADKDFLTLYPYENLVKSDRMYFDFKKFFTLSENPYSSSNSIILDSN